jgi:2-iminobutanoate/2-iminopropanoate deaminase
MNWQVEYYPEYWAGKRLAYPQVPKEAPKFARTIRVGNLIFISGCTGQDTVSGQPTSNNFEDQMNMALTKIRMAMEEAGSSMDNIVKTVMLVKRLPDYPLMRKTEVEYYLKYAPYLVDNPPASTFIAPASLAKPEFLIEIDVIGVIDRKAKGWEVRYYPEFWGGKKLAFPSVPKEHPKFARTEVAGNLIMVSGCQGMDPETLNVETNDIKEQTWIALDKMKAGMEETGSSLNNLVKTYVLLKRSEDYPKYRQAEFEYFKKHASYLVDHPPATTILFVSNLARPQFLVEVEAFGVVNRESEGWSTKLYSGMSNDNTLATRSEAAGKLLFLSGCDASDPQSGKIETDDIEEQVAISLDKVQSVLEEAGGSLKDTIKTFMLLKRLDDYPKMRRAEVDYYLRKSPYLVEYPPVSTFMQLNNLTNPKALFEIDVTAVLQDERVLKKQDFDNNANKKVVNIDR